MIQSDEQSFAENQSKNTEDKILHRSRDNLLFSFNSESETLFPNTKAYLNEMFPYRNSFLNLISIRNHLSRNNFVFNVRCE